jgi:hypothetical protein
MAATGQTVKLLDSRPDLMSAALPYWKAFNELGGQRPIGFGGAGEIRREAVTDWMNESGISDPVERLTYRSILSAMDAEYLGLIAKSAEVKDEPKGRKG